MWRDGKPWDFEEMCGWEDWPRDCLFSDLILMQSTGLLDKNGNEAYGDDIVRTQWQHDGVTNYDYEILGKIVWWDENLQWAIEHIRDKEVWLTPLCSFEREELGEVEVIGNVWEHPDLLPKAQ